jgi:hypothetical protein
MRGMFFLLGYLVSERNIDCRFFSCQLSANSVLAGSNAADDIPWLNLCQIISYRLVTHHLRVTFRERGHQKQNHVGKITCSTSSRLAGDKRCLGALSL